MKKALFVLGQLNDSDIEWLVRNGRRERVPAGTVLIRQDTMTENLYIVLSGTVTISVTHGTRANRQLGRLGSGEMLGELSFVDGSPASATVVAHDDCVVLVVPHQALEARLAADPGFAGRVYRAIALFLSDRLRTATRAQQRDEPGTPLDHESDDSDDADELSLNVLENVHLAGDRFLRVVQALSEESGQPR